MDLPSREVIHSVAFAYPYESDATLFSDRPAWTAAGEMTLDDVHAVIEWKAPRVKTRFLECTENRAIDVASLTHEAMSPFLEMGPDALDYTQVSDSLALLSQFKFVSTRIGSAILTVFRPRLFTVMDWRAWYVLAAYGVEGFDRGANLDRRDNYVKYLRTCHLLSVERGVSLRNLDRFLWVLGGTKTKTHDGFLRARESAMASQGW